MNVRMMRNRIVVRGRRGAAVAAALMLAGMLLAGGCQRSHRRADAQGSLTQAIAEVNNEPIAYEEFQNEYQLFLTKWDRFIGNDQLRKQDLKELLLQRKIDDMLLDQEARRKGIGVTDAELNARAAELLGSYMEDGQEAPPELGERELAEWLQSFRRRMVHEKLIRQEVIDRIRVTPAEMHNYYEQHKESFHLPERVNVRHIAVGSRALYNKVMRLLRGNDDFVDLVHKYSITPDRMADGELGYVERGVLPPEFDEAIFNLKRVGSISPRNHPVQTQMGYHIFRLEGRKPEETLDYREAIPEIRKRITRDKQADAYRAWLEALRDKASITIDRQLLTAE